MLRALLLAVFVLLSPFAAAAQSAPQEDLIARLEARRQAVFVLKGTMPYELSLLITSAVREGEALERAGRYQDALDRLLKLEAVCPLEDVPSFNAHMLASRLYGKLDQPEAAARQRALTEAYRELLLARTGKGATPDDPVRVVLVSEMTDWLKLHAALVLKADPLRRAGRELTVITYRGPATGNEPRQAFFLLDPRSQPMAGKKFDRYAVMAIADMQPDALHWMRLAAEARDRFLADPDVAYLELRQEIPKAIRESYVLDQQGKPREAMERLRRLETLRPIEQIPTPQLLIAYSHLVGSLGDAAKQADLRGLIFGAQQVIAHSGDGKTPQSAVHVIFIAEEYDWLQEKGLKPVKQQVLVHDGKQIDAMTAVDAKGETAIYYFDVSGFFFKGIRVPQR